MLRLAVLFLVLACATTAPAVDCNLNGVDDATETAPDCNANSTPDTCDLFPLAFTASNASGGSSRRRCCERRGGSWSHRN